MAITLNGTVGINSPDYETGTLTYSANGLIKLQDNQNTYVQAIIQNSNTGSGASADFVLSNDIGTDTVNYANFGINSSTFTGTGSFNLAGATYLLSSNSDMVIGTITANPIRFVANNNATDHMFIAANGNVGVGLSNPQYKFNIADNLNGALYTEIKNSNTGGSSTSGLIMTAGGRYVYQAANYTAQVYQIAGSNIPTYYSDFDSHNLRAAGGGTTLLSVNSTYANVQSTNLTVGSSLVVNSTSMSYNATNTFNLGTASKTANGYTYLPNGLIVQWGRVVANSTSSVTFPTAFPTACLSVELTGNSTLYVGANVPYVTAFTTTTATVRSTYAAAAASVTYLAIGY